MNGGAIWTPLPPSPSGIADYAARIYGAGEEFADAVFVTANPGERALASNRTVAPDAPEAQSARPLLQIGNNVHHDYIYDRAMAGGAIVEMHDLSLHHLHTELTLARGDVAGYRAALEANEGDWGRRFAYQRLKGYYTPNLDFHVRLSKVMTDRAAAVIVHSEWARMQLELAECRAPVYVVPHYAAPVAASAARAANRAEARQMLAIPEDAFVILSAGYVTRAKKVEWTLEAFERIAGDAPEAMMVIAGACEYALVKEMVETSVYRDRIRVTGYLSDEAFCDYTLAADVLPVMRFPSAGESSGVAARALGFGRLVIAPELMAFSDLDDRYVEKVHLDREPVDQIVEILRRWRNDPEALRRREADILAWAGEHLAPERIRRELAAIVGWHW